MITYSYLNYKNKIFISYNANPLNLDDINKTISNLINKLKEKYIINFTTTDLIILVTNSSRFFKSIITRSFKELLQVLPYMVFFDFRLDIKVYNYLMQGLNITSEKYFPKCLLLNIYNWINDDNEYTQKRFRINAGNILLNTYIYTKSALELSNLGLTSLPENVINTFVFVRKVNISNNKISFISENVFRNMKNLVELNISEQSRELDFANRAFEGTSLRIINSANNFHKVIPNALMYLNTLETLNLVSNKIIKIDDYSFQYSIKLKFLDLSFNNLESIHHNTFKNCHNIRYINFSGNRLTILPSGLFNNLLFLEEVSFLNNRINEIQKDVFMNLPNLLKINLAGNYLGEFSIEQLKNIFFNLVTNNINYLNINLVGNIFNLSTKNNIRDFFREYATIYCHINDNALMDKLEYIDNFKYHNEIACKLLTILSNTNEIYSTKFIINQDDTITINFIDPINMENIKEIAFENRDEFLNLKFIFLMNTNNIFSIYLYNSIKRLIVNGSKDGCNNPITKKIINVSDILGGEELLFLLNQIILSNTRL